MIEPKKTYKYALLFIVLPALITLALGLIVGGGVGFGLGRFVYPNVAEWDLALEDARAANAALEVQTESDYYRGVMSACVGIGVGMGMGESVASNCSTFWQMAYQADWFTELDIESWQFPPESSSGN